MRFWFVLDCHYLSGFGQVSTFLACHFYKVLARTVVLNAHTYCCTLSNMLTFFEECFGSGLELKVWRPTPESSILSVRCVRIGVTRQNSDCERWHSMTFLGGRFSRLSSFTPTLVTLLGAHT